MWLTLPEVQALRSLTPDGRVLMLTRVVRLFAYGFLSVVFALYLAELGLTDQQIGLVLTLTLIGDAVLSLWIATVADRPGRRHMLLLGAGLMVSAGLTFGLSSHLALLMLAAFIGTMSPSGGDYGSRRRGDSDLFAFLHPDVIGAADVRTRENAGDVASWRQGDPLTHRIEHWGLI